MQFVAVQGVLHSLLHSTLGVLHSMLGVLHSLLGVLHSTLGVRVTHIVLRFCLGVPLLHRVYQAYQHSRLQIGIIVLAALLPAVVAPTITTHAAPGHRRSFRRELLGDHKASGHLECTVGLLSTLEGAL